MSMTLMVEALKARIGNSGRKLVLIKLADNANDEGICWPSYQTIADACEMGRSTVKSHIAALVRQGFISINPRNDGKSSNQYVLHISRGRIPKPTRTDSDPVRIEPGQEHSDSATLENPPEAHIQNLTRSEPDPVRNRPGQISGATRSNSDPHPVRFRPPPGQNLTPEPVIESITEPVSEPVTKKQCPFAGAPVCDSRQSDHLVMFEELWDSWPSGMGQKGSRKTAVAAFLRLQPDSDVFAAMRQGLAAQAAYRNACAAENRWVEPLQHVDRWIKNRRWEDEIDPFTAVGTSATGAPATFPTARRTVAQRAEDDISATIERMTDRSWAGD